ncbi:hypothetical protein C3K47_07215 [Solitalea longa]|uniref:Uncharacterized protein n=1 Tax=Solitalea longa TaxID=2079460 RepID=A0A2S5A4T1_9SPHI|nr:hypothetical protein [Solitalea longa]POY37546.1 hypothetical protein C3K47_07215 [Solitalea longa]
MAKLKKLLKLCGLGALIILACFGVGITGAAPVLPKNRENSIIEIKVELDEEKEQKTDLLFTEHIN